MRYNSSRTATILGRIASMRQLSRAVLLVLAVLAVLAADAGAATVQPFVGSLHEHSGYSDGWPGSRPQTYYDSGRNFGLDFMSGVRALGQRRPADRRERVLPRPRSRALLPARRQRQSA